MNVEISTDTTLAEQHADTTLAEQHADTPPSRVELDAELDAAARRLAGAEATEREAWQTWQAANRRLALAALAHRQAVERYRAERVQAT